MCGSPDPNRGQSDDPRALGSGPAQPSPHSPLLRGLNPWAPPSRSAWITVRPSLRRRPPARTRPPALVRCLSATAPRSRLGLAPLGSGSPRHRGGRRLFLHRRRRSPPPPPDVRRWGGSSGGRGGTRRPAQEGVATRCDPPASPLFRRGAQTPGPPRARASLASESRSAPQHWEVGRGRNWALPWGN